MNNLKHGDVLYFIGTGDLCTFLEIKVDKDGQTRGWIQTENGRISRYHISHFTNHCIFTKNKEEINNSHWLRVSGQDDGICFYEPCNNKAGHKRYCKSCQVSRKEFFKKKYYEDRGWNTSKLG